MRLRQEVQALLRSSLTPRQRRLPTALTNAVESSLSFGTLRHYHSRWGSLTGLGGEGESPSNSGL